LRYGFLGKRGKATTLLLPPDDPSDNSAGNNGAAVFTRGGDRLRTGWLGAYAAIRR
jgi:helicase